MEKHKEFLSYILLLGVSESIPVGQEKNYIIRYFPELAKVSTKVKSIHTTVPAGIMNRFNLKEGDQLDWNIEAKESKLIIVVSPTKQKDL